MVVAGKTADAAVSVNGVLTLAVPVAAGEAAAVAVVV